MCFLLNTFQFYSCSSTVFCLFSPPLPHPSYPHLPALFPPRRRFCPCVLFNCSSKPFTLFPPLSPPLSPLVTVSLFLISMSLVIFSLFVLLIRFQLKVRSCGICLSPLDLFHLVSMGCASMFFGGWDERW